MKEFDQLLKIECANGKALPYIGYIKTELHILELHQDIPCILLIVPDSVYNNNVSLLLGANTLSHSIELCKEQHGCKSI